ncbi:hypothetical protein ACUOFU_13235 [Microbacterium arabinogalactanolyticum]|uniref:hypothetical protein n=1 Tax=Microbacterium arabinogalactanolyticum TaxID=69365 RepID=UPI004044D335
MERGSDAAARRGLVRWPMVCWLVILVLIGVAQLVRGEWFDAAVFLVAIALVCCSVLLPAQGADRPRPDLVVFAATALAAAVTLLPRHSTGMIVAVLITGVAALVASWPGASSARRAWTPGLRRLAVAWAVIMVAGCLWELAQFIVGRIAPTQPSFALSDLVDPLLDTELGKAVFAGAWLSCGAFLVLRERRGG